MKVIFMSMLLLSTFLYAGAQNDTLIFETFANNSNAWTEMDDSLNYRAVKKGKYIFENKMESGALESLINLNLDQNRDFEISCTLKKVSGVDNRAYGLVWGSDGINRYSFVISGEGQFSVDKFNKGKWHDYIAWTPARPIDSKKSDNHLRISKKGSQITVWINEKEVGKVPFESFFGNQIGFLVSRKMHVEVIHFQVISAPSSTGISIPVDVFVISDDSTKFVSLADRAKHVKNLTKDDRDNLQKQIKVYDQYLEIHPKSVEALNNKADTYIALGEYKKGRETISQILAIAPNKYEYYIKRSELAFLDGDTLAGEKDLNYVTTLDFETIEELVNLGQALMRVEKYEAAYRNFDKVVNLQPKWAEAYNMRGESYIGLNQFGKAIKDFEYALFLRPDFTAARDNISRARQVSESQNAEIEAFTTLINLNPREPANYFYRGEVRTRIEDIAGAILDYTKAIEMNYKNPDVFLKRADAHIKRDNMQAALNDYTSYLNFMPWNPVVYAARGDLRRDMGSSKGAIADYSKAISFQYNDNEIYKKRGHMLIQENMAKEAITDLSTHIKNNNRDAEAFMFRAQAKNLAGDPQGALSDYTLALQLDSENDKILYERGMLILTKMEDKNGACNDFKKAMDLGNEDAKKAYERRCR